MNATQNTATENTPSTAELLEQIRELHAQNRTLTAQNKSLEDSARHYKEMFEHYAEMADRATEKSMERKDRITELEAEVTKLETEAYITRYEKQCAVEIVPTFERYQRRWLEGYKNGNAYAFGDDQDTTIDEICMTEDSAPVIRMDLELGIYLVEKGDDDLVVSRTPTGWLAVTV